MRYWQLIKNSATNAIFKHATPRHTVWAVQTGQGATAPTYTLRIEDNNTRAVIHTSGNVTLLEATNIARAVETSTC